MTIHTCVLMIAVTNHWLARQSEVRMLCGILVSLYLDKIATSHSLFYYRRRPNLCLASAEVQSQARPVVSVAQSLNAPGHCVTIHCTILRTSVTRAELVEEPSIPPGALSGWAEMTVDVAAAAEADNGHGTSMW